MYMGVCACVILYNVLIILKQKQEYSNNILIFG